MSYAKSRWSNIEGKTWIVVALLEQELKDFQHGCKKYVMWANILEEKANLIKIICWFKNTFKNFGTVPEWNGAALVLLNEKSYPLVGSRIY